MGRHVATCLSASQRIAACYRSGWCGRTIARRASGWPRSSRRSSPRACAMRSAQTKGSSAPAATALSSCAARVLFSGRSVGTDRSVSRARAGYSKGTHGVLTGAAWSNSSVRHCRCCRRSGAAHSCASHLAVLYGWLLLAAALALQQCVKTIAAHLRIIARPAGSHRAATCCASWHAMCRRNPAHYVAHAYHEELRARHMHFDVVAFGIFNAGAAIAPPVSRSPRARCTMACCVSCVSCYLSVILLREGVTECSRSRQTPSLCG